MLSKCANPACSGTFRYLHEGRMFHLITDSEPALAIRRATVIERFWLCEECSKKLTLVSYSADGRQVKVIPCEDHFRWNGESGRLTEERRVLAPTLPAHRIL